MNKLVVIVGMCGSGKSIVADRLVKEGYGFLRFGQITLDIVKEKGLEPTEENERPIREEIRKKHGMGAYAILLLPKFKELLEKGNVVGDGMYSWSEYKVLKKEFGENFIVVAVCAPPKLRYERLEKRTLEPDDVDLRHRPSPTERSEKRDYAEIENIEKGGPIAMADYTLVNTGTLGDFHKQIDGLIEKLK